MMLIRSVRDDDLEGILQLSALAKTGLTTLPHDKKILKSRVDSAVQAFNNPVDKPGGETYLFVMEDSSSKEIVGICGIVSKIGGFEPSWTYEIKSMTNESTSLGVKKEIKYLQLKQDHNGPSEIGTLFLSPSARKSYYGRLLSLSRFMFMGQYATAFEEEVIAEMRGVISEDDKTVFWEALGKHFFDIEFHKADLMVMKDKKFIEELMPKHPIYIPLLPLEAQLVIAQVHPNTRPALRLLEQEGFKFNGEIDIFEAGPVVSTKVQDIRCVRESRICNYQTLNGEPEQDRRYLITNIRSPLDFKVTASSLNWEGDHCVALPSKVIDLLQLNEKDQVRVAPLRAEVKQ